MKTIKMLAAAAMLLSAVACNSGNTGAKIDGADSTAVAEAVKPVNPKALLPSKASVDSVSYLLGIQLGSMIKGYHLGERSFLHRVQRFNLQILKSGLYYFIFL
jgi:ABC-type cobalt transport system substrate-binding protein